MFQVELQLEKKAGVHWETFIKETPKEKQEQSQAKSQQARKQKRPEDWDRLGAYVYIYKNE